MQNFLHGNSYSFLFSILSHCLKRLIMGGKTLQLCFIATLFFAEDENIWYYEGASVRDG